MSVRERQLIDLLQAFLGDEAPRITPASRFDALGLDSLASLRFARRAQDALGIEIDLEWFYDHPTVADFAHFLDTRDGASGTGAGVRSAP